MKSIHALLVVLSAAVPATVARANHELPLQAAACEYRDAVQHFDNTVHQLHFIDHYDVRLVHRLEDAACNMHNVARHPDRIDHVLYQWQVIQSLHRRVAAAIFGRHCYPRHPDLIKCWERVSCAYQELAKQIECVCSDHRIYRPWLGGSCGTPFGLPPVKVPHATTPGAVPHRSPAATMPPTPYPGTVLPNSAAPLTQRFDNQIRPEKTPPNPVGPVPDEIRYFGQRNLDHSRSRGNRGIDGHFTGTDFRSAMIGAMLSRFIH